jgi:long-chain acyl-CoA synthetase
MAVDFMLERFRQRQDHEAVIWRDEPYTYGWLLSRLDHWRAWLVREGVHAGAVVALEADFSPNAVAGFLALVEAACIFVPLTAAVGPKREQFLEISEAEAVISIGADDEPRLERSGVTASHPLYARLRTAVHPGLVLFSSGSTGKSKAAVHDVIPLLDKFRVPRHSLRTIAFLLYDHIGGINTMLYTLSNGGCLVTVADRSPDAVLSAVERHRVQLLPTSPTFINLILISEAYTRHDLGSLTTITYGTEPMPQSTLERFHALLPHVALVQTYGLSELGILRSKSRQSDSLWVKVGGEGVETRVTDGVLHVRSHSAMLGYLNAPSPFTADGWMNTGDRVEVDGDYLRFLGRESEVINVGGEKVWPAEVESVIQEMDNVAEVTVSGAANPITGQIVCAKVTLRGPEDEREFTRRLARFCRARLQPYKVPIKVTVATERQHSARFKKLRAG